VRNRIFFKMLAASALVVVVAAITMDVTIRRVWESSLRDEIQRGLTARVRLFANRVEIDRQHSVQDITSQEALAAGARATVIDPTGQVLADSEADPGNMENHRTRKEFIAALSGNIGVDERRSHTIGIPFMYVAAPVSGGAVRLAYPLSDVEAASRRVHRALLLGSALAFVIVMLLSAIGAQYTARRLQAVLPPAISPPGLPQLRSTKLARSQPRSIRPRARLKKAFLRCRQVSASWRPC
jgi:two-component system phosphate regulon sensor histidine kinase PhoR